MYSEEDKRRAVELFTRYDMSCMSAINELGYPCRQTLYGWYEEYKRTGKIERRSMERYTEEEKATAVEHYLVHGKCNARTRCALGYPSSSDFESDSESESDSVAGISCIVGVSRDTVYKHLEKDDFSPEVPTRKPVRSMMDECRPVIEGYFEGNSRSWRKQEHNSGSLPHSCHPAATVTCSFT